MQTPRTVAVLGGGIGGLVSAYYLAQRAALGKTLPIRILLFERAPRFGGWIHSTRLGTNYHSHLFELGPRTLRLESGIASLSDFTAVNTLNLLNQLDLMKDQFCPIEKTAGANKNRLIYHQNRLVNLNDLSLVFGGKPLIYPPIVYLLYEYLSTSGRLTVQDETIKSFMHRRFGVLSDEIVEYLLDPLMKGVYAGDVSQLSARSVLKKLFRWEQHYGSIINGFLKTRKNKTNQEKSDRIFQDLNLIDYKDILEKYAIYYFRDGMEVLAERLVESLSTMNNVELIQNQSIDRIEFTPDQEIPVTLFNQSKKKYTVDHLISAVPSFELAKMIDNQELSILKNRLNQISFVDMVVVNLLYEKEDIYPTDAFGYLIPSREGSYLLGVLFDTCVRHQVDGKKRGSQLTVMMGGAWYDELRLDEYNDQQLMNIVRKELKKQINLDEKPTFYSISRLNRAIPNYNVGHEDLLDDIYTLIRRHRLPLTLVGNSYRGIGISDVIYDARIEMEYINFQKIQKI